LDVLAQKTYDTGVGMTSIEVWIPLYVHSKFSASFMFGSRVMKAGLSLNVFWQGISKPLLGVDSALMFKRLYCALVWLNFFPGNCVSQHKINCSFLVTLTERLHSWYCSKLDH